MCGCKKKVQQAPMKQNRGYVQQSPNLANESVNNQVQEKSDTTGVVVSNKNKKGIVQ
jgi:hypothetical protein